MGEWTPSSQQSLPETRTEDEHDPRILSLLTTRGNLVGFLSSGMIFPTGERAPDWVRTKYYPDPGSLTPDLIPLFTRDPGRKAIAALLNEEGNQFPVLVDLKSDMIRDAFLMIDLNYRIIPFEKRLRNQAIVVLVRGVIPTTAVDRIVFRNEDEREDFKLQPFDNFCIDDSGIPLRTEPSRFSLLGLDPEPLAQAFNDSVRQGPPITSDAADALGGAVVLVARFAEQNPELALPRLKALLDQIWTREPDRAAYDSNDFLLMTPETLLPALSAAGPVPGEMLDRAAFSTALAELPELSPNRFSPSSFLAGLEAELSGRFPDAQPLFTRLLDISQGFASEAALPEEMPPLIQGLLDFCRSPRPESIVRATVGTENSSDRTLAYLLLAGALQGRGRIPLDQRPSAHALLHRIDGLVARRLNTLVGASELMGPVSPLRVEQGSGVERLVAKDTVLLQRVQPGPSIKEVQPVQVPSTGATELGPDREEHMHLKKPAEIASYAVVTELSRPELRTAALELCKVMGWNEFVAAMINLPTGQLSTSLDASGGLNLVLHGTGVLSPDQFDYRVDEAAFIARLSSDFLLIPSEVRSSLSELFTHLADTRIDDDSMLTTWPESPLAKHSRHSAPDDSRASAAHARIENVDNAGQSIPGQTRTLVHEKAVGSPRGEPANTSAGNVSRDGPDDREVTPRPSEAIEQSDIPATPAKKSRSRKAPGKRPASAPSQKAGKSPTDGGVETGEEADFTLNASSDDSGQTGPSQETLNLPKSGSR